MLSGRQCSLFLPGKKRKKSKGEIIFLAAMLAIPLVNFCALWLVVNFNAIMNAFKVEIDDRVIFSFVNWRLFWQDLVSNAPGENMAMLLRNTLIFFSWNLFLILPLSFLFSFFLYKKIVGYKFYRVMFFLPNIVSSAVLATLYKFMLNPGLGGIVPKLYEVLSGSAGFNFLMNDKTALWAVLAYCLWTGFSVNLVLFNGAMERVPKEVLEASEIDGVGMIREVTHIIIPMIWSTISTLIIMAVANMFMASGPLLLLTNGAYNTNTISFWMFLQVKNQMSPYYPSTAGLIFTIIGVPLVFGVKKAVESVYKDVQY